jgi:hypothetical protein
MDHSGESLQLLSDIVRRTRSRDTRFFLDREKRNEKENVTILPNYLRRI